VGPRAGMDVCEKSRPHRDSIHGTSSPLSVAIPTELPGPPNTRTEINKAYVAKGRKYGENTESNRTTFNKREIRKGERYK
jgi:hypothetical protein